MQRRFGHLHIPDSNHRQKVITADYIEGSRPRFDELCCEILCRCAQSGLLSFARFSYTSARILSNIPEWIVRQISSKQLSNLDLAMNLFELAKRPFRCLMRDEKHHDGVADQIKSSDVMLASFPRSGNTWFRYLLGDVILQSVGIETDTQLPVDIEYLVPALRKIETLPVDALPVNWPLSMRILKTHQPFHAKMKRAILLFRDPADALCSYFHYHLRYGHLKPVAAAGIDQFCQDNLSRWKNHLASFLAAEQNRRCELIAVSYESLQESPVEELLRVCRFLQIDATRTICESAVEHHAFSMHKQKEQQSSCGDSSRPAFFRQGTIGSSRNELSTVTYNAIQKEADLLYKRAMTLNPNSRAA